LISDHGIVGSKFAIKSLFLFEIKV